MPVSRFCASCVSACIRDLKRVVSWVLADVFLAGSLAPFGNVYELHLAPERLELVDERGVLGGLLWRRLSHPKSWQTPISMTIRLHCLRSKVVGSRGGVFGTPLAYMRSGAVPCPALKRLS
jgi:hypothetical protein